MASFRPLVFLGLGLAVIHSLGLYDDFVNLRAPLKFLIQLVAGGLVALSGATFSAIELPWIGVVQVSPWLAIPVTAFWVVSIANAVNLIDGADGFAGGVSMIIAAFIGVIALGQGALLTSILAFALVGSLAGFLIYNFPPARIFMGDGGSLTIGYLVAALPLLGFTGVETFGERPPVPIFPLVTLLYLPIVDTLLAIFRRVARGLPVHAADREHIHHRLIDRGLHGRRLLAVIYASTIVFGIVAASWFTLPAHVSALIAIATWTIALLAIMAIGRGANRDRPSV